MFSISPLTFRISLPHVLNFTQNPCNFTSYVCDFTASCFQFHSKRFRFHPSRLRFHRLMFAISLKTFAISPLTFAISLPHVCNSTQNVCDFTLLFCIKRPILNQNTHIPHQYPIGFTNPAVNPDTNFAKCNNNGSLQYGPTTWIPRGKPSLPIPKGMFKAGKPVALKQAT